MSLLYLAISFLLSGMMAVMVKALAEYDNGVHRVVAMLSYYATAMLIAIIIARSDTTKRSIKDAQVGLSMGLFGILNFIVFLIVLQHVEGIVAFPVRNLGNLILTAAFSVVVWKEKLSKSQWLAIALSLIGVWLIY